MTNRYRMENRAVLLFRLTLTSSQLSKLWEDLRAEHIRREQSILTDYNFLSRNCLTEALRFVNNVLEPQQKKFVYLDSQNTFELLAVKYLAMPGLYMQNAPYAIAPQIASHPLAIGGPLVLPPAMVTNAKLVVKLEKQTQYFLNLCKANEKIKEAL